MLHRYAEPAFALGLLALVAVLLFRGTLWMIH